jgi:hypothetical protein
LGEPPTTFTSGAIGLNWSPAARGLPESIAELFARLKFSDVPMRVSEEQLALPVLEVPMEVYA